MASDFQIIAKSGNNNDLKLLRAFLAKNQQLIASQANQIDTALAMLDAAQHSLGYTFLLWVKGRSSFKDESLFIRQVDQLFSTGNTEQIAFVCEHFVAIAQNVQKRFHKKGRHLASLLLLRKGIRTLQPTPSHLTPIHVYLFQNAIQAQCYHVGVALLDEMPTDMDPHATNFAITDFLLYCYYGSLLYTGVKRFKDAMQLQQLAISAPAMALSAIVFECHKKYLLLSLIEDGKPRHAPKQASGMITRTLKMLTHPAYVELATAYSTGSTDELHKVAEKHIAEFQSDKNFGLVKQVIQSLYQRNILRTTKVYLTLSLGDIKESAALQSEKEVESRILRMIADGVLSASINQSQSTVSFNSDSESYNTAEMVAKLEQHLQNALQMHERATALDEQIITDPAYIRKKLHEKMKGAAWGGDIDEATELAIAESMAR